jgi:hypothetical protein
MDTSLDDKAAMAARQIRLRPIMVRSLHEAGYLCLGDLRWVSLDQLIQVFYIGRKTAKLERRNASGIDETGRRRMAPRARGAGSAASTACRCFALHAQTPTNIMS